MPWLSAMALEGRNAGSVPLEISAVWLGPLSSTTRGGGGKTRVAGGAAGVPELTATAAGLGMVAMMRMGRPCWSIVAMVALAPSGAVNHVLRLPSLRSIRTIWNGLSWKPAGGWTGP